MSQKKVAIVFFISSGIELLSGLIAYFFARNSTLLGAISCLSVLCLITICSLLFPNHYFLRNAKPDSGAKLFWEGKMSQLYLNFIEKRSSMWGSILEDTWLILVILGACIYFPNPMISSFCLGFASAFSLLTILDFFIRLPRS